MRAGPGPRFLLQSSGRDYCAESRVEYRGGMGFAAAEGFQGAQSGR